MKRSFFPSVLFLFVLAGSLAIGAQTAPPATAAAPQAEAARQQPQGQSLPAARRQPHDPSDGNFLTPQTEQSHNLVAAEDEDDNAVYRHSASVRAIGRWFHLAPEPAARLFEFLNFAILFGALLFFLVKYLPGMMRARREAIQKQLMEARTATEQANARLAAVEQKFARLDQEIASIRTHAEQESAAEETRIKALMEAERQRIIASAEQEIAVAASAARRELKRFAGALAIDRAAKKISLDESGDRALLRQFVQDLGQEARFGGRN